MASVHPLSKGSRPPEFVLAWLLVQGPDVAPIPGTKRRERLDENLGALQVRLSGEDVTHVSEAIPAGAATGSRYPDMAAVYRGMDYAIP